MCLYGFHLGSIYQNAFHITVFFFLCHAALLSNDVLLIGHCHAISNILTLLLSNGLR